MVGPYRRGPLKRKRNSWLPFSTEVRIEKTADNMQKRNNNKNTRRREKGERKEEMTLSGGRKSVKR